MPRHNSPNSPFANCGYHHKHHEKMMAMKERAWKAHHHSSDGDSTSTAMFPAAAAAVGGKGVTAPAEEETSVVQQWLGEVVARSSHSLHPTHLQKRNGDNNSNASQLFQQQQRPSQPMTTPLQQPPPPRVDFQTQARPPPPPPLPPPPPPPPRPTPLPSSSSSSPPSPDFVGILAAHNSLTDPNSKYIRVAALGSGTFAQAWVVVRRKDKRVLAAKIMQLKPTDSKIMQRAQSEVQCLQSCSHFACLSFVEHFLVDNRLLIIVEYCNAGDLASFIKESKASNTPFPEATIAIIILQLILAIEHMHRRKIIHRDIKSQNVFLSTTGLVKVGDFGLSNEYDTISGDVANTFCGTPYYLAPEVWRRQRYGTKTDIWALGVLSYELITGRCPFTAGDFRSLLTSVTSTTHTPIREVIGGGGGGGGKVRREVPSSSPTYSPTTDASPSSPPSAPPQSSLFDISDELIAVVDCMLQKDPRQRPSAFQLLQMPYMRNVFASFLPTVLNTDRVEDAMKDQIAKEVGEVAQRLAEADVAAAAANGDEGAAVADGGGGGGAVVIGLDAANSGSAAGASVSIEDVSPTSPPQCHPPPPPSLHHPPLHFESAVGKLKGDVFVDRYLILHKGGGLEVVRRNIGAKRSQTLLKGVEALRRAKLAAPVDDSSLPSASSSASSESPSVMASPPTREEIAAVGSTIPLPSVVRATALVVSPSSPTSPSSQSQPQQHHLPSSFPSPPPPSSGPLNIASIKAVRYSRTHANAFVIITRQERHSYVFQCGGSGGGVGGDGEGVAGDKAAAALVCKCWVEALNEALKREVPDDVSSISIQ